MQIEEYGWYVKSGNYLLALDENLTFDQLTEKFGETCIYTLLYQGEPTVTLDITLEKHGIYILVNFFSDDAEFDAIGMSFDKDMNCFESIKETLKSLSEDMKDAYDTEIQDLIRERDMNLKPFMDL